MSMKPFDKKTTPWLGLWYHQDSHSFSSEVINLAALREFKGNVRLYMRKNKFWTKDSNRPNYVFSICDANSQRFVQDIEVIDDEWDREPYSKLYQRQDGYFDEEGNRYFSREEVRTIINGTVSDVKSGIYDPYDILPEDFV